MDDVVASDYITVYEGKYVTIPTVYTKIKLLTSTAKIPTYATPYSAGADLYLDLNGYDSVDIFSHDLFTAHTGIALEIKDGYVGEVYPRSSIGKKGLMLANTVGIIDSDYRGEILLMFYNYSDKTVTLKAGDRIGQIIFKPYMRGSLDAVDSLSKTGRGSGGFGSTGR